MADITLTSNDALIVVDVQKDFLPGGSLATPQGDDVVPVLNQYIERFQRADRPIFATRDWHPADHCSFKAQGGPWPPHCIAGSEGAAFAPDLALPENAAIISKATEKDREAYSGFEGTDLADQLRTLNVERLFIGGLTTDYCVLNTVKDAASQGFSVCLLEDAVRAVKSDDGEKAKAQMRQLGARFITLGELAS